MKPSSAQPTAEPSETAKAFGLRLKELRLSLLSERTGKSLTQLEMASRIYVGNKSVVSMFESGKRLPTEDTLREYAKQCDCDEQDLIDARSAVLAADQPVPSATAPDQVPASGVAAADPVAPLRRRHRGRWITGAVVVVVAGVAGVLVVTSRGSSAANQVSITEPDTSVGIMTPVRGTVSGYTNDDLWLDVQSIDGDRHHTTDTPVDRSGDTFSFGTLYVGQPASRGVVFRISVIATVKGSAADRQLVAYGARRKDVRGAYAGLVELPSGAHAVASVLVQRQ